MFNADAILAQLQAGQDADTIAKEFTVALNRAVQQNAAQPRFNEKVEYMNEIIEDLFDFIHEFYPDMDIEGARDEIDATEIIKSFDAAYKDVVRLKGVIKARSQAKPNITIKDDGGIDEFLKAHGLK